MPLQLDHQLREQMEHSVELFPISYFDNELDGLPERTVPLHWHPEFEFVSVRRAEVEVQVGMERTTLRAGESLFINGSVLHGMRQTQNEISEPMPNIVLLGSLVAPEGSAVHSRYILPVADCTTLPFARFRREIAWQAEVCDLLEECYALLKSPAGAWEMRVQRAINSIFEAIFLHMNELPRVQCSRVQLAAQLRLRQMQACIRERYDRPLSLDELAAAARISRSEANRCFQACMGCSPMEALLQYRLNEARRLLRETELSVKEVALRCGFNSESYFQRRFRRAYGCSAGAMRELGKSSQEAPDLALNNA